MRGRTTAATMGEVRQLQRGVRVGGIGVAGADRRHGARARARRGASRGVPSAAAGRGHRAVRGGRRGRHGSRRG